MMILVESLLLTIAIFLLDSVELKPSYTGGYPGGYPGSYPGGYPIGGNVRWYNPETDRPANGPALTPFGCPTGYVFADGHLQIEETSSEGKIMRYYDSRNGRPAYGPVLTPEGEKTGYYLENGYVKYASPVRTISASPARSSPQASSSTSSQTSSRSSSPQGEQSMSVRRYKCHKKHGLNSCCTL
ncbi:uncharacterized protein LOC117171626 [Belonocnema kinseyi]|uniref:uncharacterized protein LOC117171626 n=1 Tax=Belonocnema kinseyi TaxID=2817044 RepID=UPI00143D15AB|nr:uncharacterized protein LOC117171626 [Belonocnema kinseyi]